MIEYEKIEVDQSSFVVLSDSYAKDNSQVFYRGKLLNGVDLATFEVVPQDYSYVLNRQNIYEVANDINKSEDFQKEGEFAIDRYSIYFNENKIAENNYDHIVNFATNLLVADSDIIIGNINGGYKVMLSKQIDTDTFHPYSESFWADKNTVYCFNRTSQKLYPIANLNRSNFRYFKTKEENQFFHVYGDGNVYYYAYGDCLQTSLL